MFGAIQSGGPGGEAPGKAGVIGRPQASQFPSVKLRKTNETDHRKLVCGIVRSAVRCQHVITNQITESYGSLQIASLLVQGARSSELGVLTASTPSQELAQYHVDGVHLH